MVRSLLARRLFEDYHWLNWVHTKIHQFLHWKK